MVDKAVRNISLLIENTKHPLSHFYYNEGLLYSTSKVSQPNDFFNDLQTDISLSSSFLKEDENKKKDYFTLLRISKVYNRLLENSRSKLFVDLRNLSNSKNVSLHVIIPSFYRYHLSIDCSAEDVPERNNYSFPIENNGRFAYYKDYDGKDKIVDNLSPEDKERIIKREISKNQADARSIFMYTQTNRIFRPFNMSINTSQYFADNIKDEDIYDLGQIEEGPLCCSELSTPSVTTIGHATLLFQFPEEGINILTDPVFNALNGVLYPRKTNPAWKEFQIPLIDIIVISHNHRDHVDEKSLKQLRFHQPIVLVPKGDGPFIKSLGYENVIEHSTWQITKVLSKNEGTNITNSINLISVPANHWSCRGLTDANKSLFLGWIFQPSNGGSIYFSGDTAELCDKDTKDIFMNPNFNDVVLNLVPGGPNHKRGTMQNTHASAADGIFSHFFQLFLKMKEVEEDKKKYFENLIAESDCITAFMHHNTFELGIDRFNEAEYVRDDLIGALQGNDSQYAFVNEIVDKLKLLLQSVDLNLDDNDTLNIIIEEIKRVYNPKIGEVMILK